MVRDHGSIQRRMVIILAVLSFIIFVANLALITGSNIPIPKFGGAGDFKTGPSSHDGGDFEKGEEEVDGHPIAQLMKEASARFMRYDNSRSQSFVEAVEEYRARYGRHPPPGFDRWYKFARERNVYNVDDFDQIWDDLRPFWSIPPMELRELVRGMLKEDSGRTGLAGITIERGKITVEGGDWRSEVFEKMLKVFVKELPDMQIAMNKLDQPRVVVEWEELQKHLKEEADNRVMNPTVKNAFSMNRVIDDSTELPTGEWFGAAGKQYMELASKACPPESYARNSRTMDPKVAEAKYKLPKSGGLISNFNISSDLCTVGPALAELHGMLFSPASIMATRKLVPVFGECKVNVNNDILFPANMYYKDEPRFRYESKNDVVWDDKQVTAFWRGITSGGTQTINTWRQLHRHRLVQLANTTLLESNHDTFSILKFDPAPTHKKNYTEGSGWSATEFAGKYLDVGFSGLEWCVPDTKCGWLRDYLKEVPGTDLMDQFRFKYLVDVDGHSFSGRWNAFLKSRSLGIKATIFREWHDSRLFSWHHFAPMDNRFDDLYTLLTYFIGVGSPHPKPGPKTNIKDRTKFYVPSHDLEAKRLASQGRQWAAKVLRKEDIEIYMFRLMLEYARVMDDHRDSIGYSGTGDDFEERP